MEKEKLKLKEELLGEKGRKKNDIVYDSVTIHFNFSIFLWELIVHIFYPLFNCYKPTIHRVVYFGRILSVKLLLIILVLNY